MFQQPMSRSEFRPEESAPDSAHHPANDPAHNLGVETPGAYTLERHIRAGFPPDLALDLVLHELVVRAAQATHAAAAALALVRGNEMVCRAATGHLAPDLGIPLNTRDGLSGASLQTRQPQLSVDTEFDPRVDPAISRILGIRSILIVPVFARNKNDNKSDHNKNEDDMMPAVIGLLEMFATTPVAFSATDQKLLEGFSEECTRICEVAHELTLHKPVATGDALSEIALPQSRTSRRESLNLADQSLADHELVAPVPTLRSESASRRSPYEVWTLVLGGLAILAFVAVSFLIGSRIGWLRSAAPYVPFTGPNPAPVSAAQTNQPQPPKQLTKGSSAEKASAKSPPQKPSAPAPDELVVYEKGKVVFRMKPTRPDGDPIVQAAATAKINSNPPAGSSAAKPATPQSVWLAPAEAETRVLTRTEPEYPSAALTAHRSGAVVLEVGVAEDGSVSTVRPLSGDRELSAAATAAVRTWRYRPYRQHDRPTPFQTDVTLTFTLPD
jgi:TonB family protein